MAASSEKSQIVSFTLPSPTVGYSIDYMSSLVRSLEISLRDHKKKVILGGQRLF